MTNLGKVLVFPENKESYELVLAFDSDDLEFTRGFEAGRVYEALKTRKEAFLEFQVHGANETMMDRIALATGYLIELTDLEGDEEWLTLRFVRQSKI